MKNQLEYSEFIERYLDGEMTGHELIWFEKELDANDQLQSELHLRKKVGNAIADHRLIDFRKELDEAYALYQESTGVAHTRPKRLFQVAGVMSVALLAVFLVLNLTMKNVNNQRLFDKYYEPYEANMTFRAADVDMNATLKTAMQYYENKNFTEALKLFEQILQSDPGRVGLNFYSGISRMEMKEYESAGTSFNKVVDDKYNLYIEQAEWYLSLCYIVTGQDEKALELLEGIVTNKKYNYKEARKLMRRLK
ncbi:MAG: tetratricopeptide repeat protein [Bacteroidales bacterium]|nr:tetratricopeptide repeat protein [Bacteroidales bacterium]